MKSQLLILAALFVATTRAQGQVFFTNVFRSGINFQFEIVSPTTQGCVLQAADSLSTAQWKEVSATTQGTLTFPFDRPHRFFRIKCGNEYSLNVVGYVTLTIQPRFSLIANPLVARTNSVEVLFAGVPDGTTIYKFSAGAFSVNGFEFGEWANPSQTLLPGEGAFLFHPGPDPISIIFTGEVASGPPTNRLPAGFSIVSAWRPVSGGLGDIGFPFKDGDTAFRWNGAVQSYITRGYEFGEWSLEPSLLIGEAFFINLSAPRNWCPVCPFPPVTISR